MATAADQVDAGATAADDVKVVAMTADDHQGLSTTGAAAWRAALLKEREADGAAASREPAQKTGVGRRSARSPDPHMLWLRQILPPRQAIGATAQL